MQPLRGFFLCLGLLCLACGRFGDTTRPADVTKPTLPHIGGPPPTTLPELDLVFHRPPPFDKGTVAAGPDDAASDIYAKADEAFAMGDNRIGTALLDLATRRDALPVRGFELARQLAAFGEDQASMYWLSVTAVEYGLDADWVVMFPEFSTLWKHPQWDKLAAWLVKLNRFHENRPAPTPWLVLPESHQVGDALPLVVWFPALGQRDPFATWAPQVADALGVALVSIRGNVPVGPEEAVWSGDADNDRNYVRSVITEMWSTVQAEGRRVIVAGSGRGAQYAVEMAAREPRLVAGVVALWPTGDLAGAGSKHDRIGRGGRRAVLVAGASRDSSAHVLIRKDRGRLQRLNDDVQMRIDNRPWQGHLPPDFPAPFITWLDFVLTGETAPW
jgi:hypothetical protein